jgi:MYXO-CTERM domain-containing protein
MRTRNWGVSFTIIGWAASAGAATVTLAPGDDYTKLEAAGPGDTVLIQPGTYQFRVHLDGQGTAAAPIVIKAADPAQRPVFDLAGQDVESWPGSYTGGDNGRGCWQITGSYYEISGIDFQNCHTSSSGNAAGIRTVGTDHVTLRDLRLLDSDVGFSGDGENTVVEFSEIAGNGHPGNPPQHNVYVYGGSIAIRYSFIHDSVGGQNLHIRARDSAIEYNWIARAGNYEVDMMTGNDPDHAMLFRGNVLVGNPSPDNGGQVFALYNDVGSGGITMALTAVFNTFVIQVGSNPALVNIVNGSLQSASVELSNNIVVGTNQPYAIADSGTSNATVSGENNWLETGANAGALTGTVFGADPGFVSAGTLDFTLGSGSAAIGAASQSVSNAPDREYWQNEQNARKFRWRATQADLGALESTTSGNGYGPYDDPGQPPPGGSGGGAGSGGSGGGSAGAATAGSGGSGASSAGGSGGSAAGSGGKASASSDDGGCGCRVAERRGMAGAWLFALGLFALGRRRRS